MAKKEDIFERIRRINPQAPDMIDEIIENLRKHGCDCDAMGFLTEDMTFEEIKMVCLETNLKAGLSLEEAQKEAEKEAKIIYTHTQKIKAEESGNTHPFS